VFIGCDIIWTGGLLGLRLMCPSCRLFLAKRRVLGDFSIADLGFFCWQGVARLISVLMLVVAGPVAGVPLGLLIIATYVLRLVVQEVWVPLVTRPEDLTAPTGLAPARGRPAKLAAALRGSTAGN